MSNLGEVMSEDRKPPRMYPPAFPPEPPRPTPQRMTPATPAQPFPVEPLSATQASGPHARNDTERMLREYLQGWKQDQNEGNTIKTLREEVHDARLEMGQMRIDLNELSTEQRLMRLRMDRHGKAIRELRAKVFHNDEHEVDTDVHQVEDLKRHLQAKEAELRERRDSMTWWKRKKTDMFLAALGAIALLGIGAMGTLIWYIITMPKGK